MVVDSLGLVLNTLLERLVADPIVLDCILVGTEALQVAILIEVANEVGAQFKERGVLDARGGGYGGTFDFLLFCLGGCGL